MRTKRYLLAVLDFYAIFSMKYDNYKIGEGQKMWNLIIKFKIYLIQN